MFIGCPHINHRCRRVVLQNGCVLAAMASDGAGGAVRVGFRRASPGMADVGVTGWRWVSWWRLGYA